jgi:plastocyanin
LGGPLNQGTRSDDWIPRVTRGAICPAKDPYPADPVGLGALLVKYVRFALPLVAVAALAGCGVAPKATAGTAPSVMATMPGMTTSAVAADPVQGAPVATDSVAIKNFAFSPAVVTVRVGTTVTWTNSDQDAHTVTATGGAFRSPTMNTADTFRYTFTEAGRYDYLCTIHPFMTATVVVTP